MHVCSCVCTVIYVCIVALRVCVFYLNNVRSLAEQPADIQRVHMSIVPSVIFFICFDVSSSLLWTNLSVTFCNPPCLCSAISCDSLFAFLSFPPLSCLSLYFNVSSAFLLFILWTSPPESSIHYQGIIMAIV